MTPRIATVPAPVPLPVPARARVMPTGIVLRPLTIDTDPEARRIVGAPRVRIGRRRDATGDLLPGWAVYWSGGRTCDHTTYARAWACLDRALAS